jgi:hypothetical protein
MSWTEGVREKTAGEVIAVDGKTARGLAGSGEEPQSVAQGQCLGECQPAGARAGSD